MKYLIVPESIAKKYIPAPLDGYNKELNPLDLTTYVQVSMTAQCENMAVTGTYDTALPQPIVDNILRLTGKDICGHAVWSYAKNSIFGELLPITRQGVFIKEVYEHITENFPRL